MIRVFCKDSTPYYLSPCPLISISNNILRNKLGNVGSNYNITLNGHIIVPYGIRFANRMKYIIEMQSHLRKVFGIDGQMMEIGHFDAQDFTVVQRMFPNLISIDFQEGEYIDKCSYTIVLEAPILFDGNNRIFPESNYGSFRLPKPGNNRSYYSYNSDPDYLYNIRNTYGGLVEDFSDTWSIEVDDTYAATYDSVGRKSVVGEARTEIHDIYDNSDIKEPRSYKITRNMSAIGRTYYASGASYKRYDAIDEAYNFIMKTLLQEKDDVGQYYNIAQNEKYQLCPNYVSGLFFSSGVLNLPSYYKGFNHVRTISYDKGAGSCSVTDSWILCSGQGALENYTVSIDSNFDNPRKTVKINGNIKGLSPLHASGYQKTPISDIWGTAYDSARTPYSEAVAKYYAISNNARFGINSPIYNRARYLASGVFLNSQPLSISLASNELAGEITYSIEFDDRPLNYFSGVLSENIIVNDTYPGDVYALIPVIGRTSGPVIQVIRTKTEHKRDVSIEILLDYTDLNYTTGFPTNNYDPNATRSIVLLNKPSLNEPMRSDLKYLLDQLSPKNDAYVTQYYLNPPQETWSPKEGRYTLNLQWVYGKSI